MRNFPHPGKVTDPMRHIPYRRQIQLLERPIDDRPGGAQSPAVSVESAWKGQFLGGKAMGKTMHPHLAVPDVGMKPHTRFGQPRLRRDFIGSGSNAAATMLQSVTYEALVEVHQNPPMLKAVQPT